ALLSASGYRESRTGCPTFRCNLCGRKTGPFSSCSLDLSVGAICSQPRAEKAGFFAVPCASFRNQGIYPLKMIFKMIGGNPVTIPSRKLPATPRKEESSFALTLNGHVG